MNNAVLRVILIGGPSNVGKSTLAQSLASRLGWKWTSTDSLARHPGRPWGNPRPQVAEHYLSLSPDELIEEVIRHYTSMWPGIQNLITTHASDSSSEPLILEGSALLPDLVVELRVEGISALWLMASDRFLQERIHRVSGYEQASVREKVMIEKFIGRTCRYNEQMMQALYRLGLPWINVEETLSLEDLTNQALRLLNARKYAQADRQ